MKSIMFIRYRACDFLLIFCSRKTAQHLGKHWPNGVVLKGVMECVYKIPLFKKDRQQKRFVDAGIVDSAHFGDFDAKTTNLAHVFPLQIIGDYPQLPARKSHQNGICI